MNISTEQTYLVLAIIYIVGVIIIAIGIYVWCLLGDWIKDDSKDKTTVKDYNPLDEYHKIKDTLIMKDISVCLMQDGSHKVINKGRPIPSLMPIGTYGYRVGYGIENKPLKMTKSHCCRKCVEYYRGRVAHQRSNTAVEAI